jgi:hypothetical protein
MAASRRLGVAVAACILGGLSACGDRQPRPGITATAVTPGRLATMITGSVRLGATGEIEVDGAVPTWRAQISETRADTLAEAWSRVFASMARTFLERQHGEPINVAALHACGRTYFARSPFQPLPASIPDATQRTFGPYWLVTLCDGSGPAISLAVSAYATDLTLVGGELRFPQLSGEEFKWVGIPAGSAGLPLPPEEAVATTFVQTGRRIAATPELIISGRSIPQLARWHLRLDSAASLRTAHGIVHESDVYVAQRLAGDTVLAHAAPDQPKSVTYEWLSPPPQHWLGPGAPPVVRHYAQATVTPGTPIVFETVVGIAPPSSYSPLSHP